MSTITVMDPVTRIEGHMKVKLNIETVKGQTQIVDARCTGTLFRGFEKILEGRDPRDAPVITARICGVCPVSHGMASVKALENAVQKIVPENARLLRNLTLGANYLQSHIIHFYLMAVFDFVRGPRASPWVPSWEVDIRDSYSLDGIIEHLDRAIEARRRAHEMGAVFGGKMPTPHTYIPGGFTANPTPERIAVFREHLDWLFNFIHNTYIPDVNAIAEVYSDYLKKGAGCGNLLAYGGFELNSHGDDKLFKGGYVEPGAPRLIQELNIDHITEGVTYSWYDDSTNNLMPAEGDTLPVYPKTNAYSWIKAPRYGGKPCEVGPLARMWINGDYQRGISVMDRHLARVYEALKMTEAMSDWLDALQPKAPVYEDYFTPDSGSGAGLTEAPRGALGLWIRISEKKIDRYQVLTPTCWNASPRDDLNTPGPMEQALIGISIQDPDKPIEALRVIHSFDPCLSCSVH
jgi:hydrogenase large subunit